MTPPGSTMRAVLILLAAGGAGALAALYFTPAAPVAAPPAPSREPDRAPPAATVAPSFDIVRIGPQGNAVIAGRAEPGADVVVRDRDTEIARTRADRSGAFVALPAAPLPPGGSALTLASRDPAGGTEVAGDTTAVVIVGRALDAVTVPAPDPLPMHGPTAEPAAVPQVVIQPGQSLWRLAQTAYGQGTQYSVIYLANRDRIKDPNLIFPGQAIAVPAH